MKTFIQSDYISILSPSLAGDHTEPDSVLLYFTGTTDSLALLPKSIKHEHRACPAPQLVERAAKQTFTEEKVL